MKVINSKKAVMIGCGFVGSASVFALMQSGLFTEIVLIDADKNKAEGEAMDISHGIPFASPGTEGAPHWLERCATDANKRHFSRCCPE